MKKIFMLLMTFLLMISCGGDKKSGGDAGGDGKEVTLRFSWWGGDERHEKTLQVIKLADHSQLRYYVHH